MNNDSVFPVAETLMEELVFVLLHVFIYLNPLLQSSQKGVMIRRVDPTSASSKALEPNDILLSFDGVPVANDGTVPFRSGERIGFSYLVSQKYVDEQATLRVLKNGKEQTVKIKLKVRGCGAMN